MAEAIELTPIKQVSEAVEGAILTERVRAFVSNLSYLTYVDDSERSVFDELYRRLQSQLPQKDLEEATDGLKVSLEWKAWVKDMHEEDAKGGLASQTLFFKLLKRAETEVRKLARKRKVAYRQTFVDIGHKIPAAELDEGDVVSVHKFFKPDLATVAAAAGSKLGPELTFAEMLVAWELKRSKQVETAQSEVALSLMRSNQVLRDDPFRAFVYSVFVAGDRLKLYQLNRGAVLCYESGLTITQEPMKFTKFVAWMMLADDTHLGVLAPPEKMSGFTLDILPSVNEFNIPSPCFRIPVDVVTSRGTTVWPVTIQRASAVPDSPGGDEVSTPGSSSVNEPPDAVRVSRGMAALQLLDSRPKPDLAVLKLGWASKSRTSEGKILSQLQHIRELPKIFAWKDSLSTDAIDVLLSAPHTMREIIAGARQHAHLVISSPSIPVRSSKSLMVDGTSDTSDRAVTKPGDAIQVAKRIAHSVTAPSGHGQRKTVEKSVDLPYVEELSGVRLESAYHPRQLRYCLLEYCGVAIETAPQGPTRHAVDGNNEVTDYERIAALRSALHAVRNLFAEGDPMLHRDVSAANIMVSPPGAVAAGAPPGRLIDFDLARAFVRQHAAARDRTGTLLFMAIHRLRGTHARHLPWHDIESIFWVLFFTELNRTTAGASRRHVMSIVHDSVPNTDQLTDFSRNKEQLVTNEWRWWASQDVPALFSRTPFPVVRLLHRLRMELFVYDGYKQAGGLGDLDALVNEASERHVYDTMYEHPRFALKPEDIVQRAAQVAGAGEAPNRGGRSQRLLRRDHQRGQDDRVQDLQEAVRDVVGNIDAWFQECLDALDAGQAGQSSNAGVS